MARNKGKNSKLIEPGVYLVIVAVIGGIATIIAAIINARAQRLQVTLELTQTSLVATMTENSSRQTTLNSTQTPFDVSRSEFNSTLVAFELTQTSFEASQQEAASTQSALNSTQASLDALRTDLYLTQTALAPTASPTVTPTATSIINPEAELCTRDNSLGWEFDTGTEGWRNRSQLFDTTAREGNMVATISGSDPYWEFPAGLKAIDASLYSVVEIRYRISDTFDDTAQFMWTTNSTKGNQWKDFTITTDNEWHIAILKLPIDTNWVGIVTSLRFDPVKYAESGKVNVDYIRFCDPY